MLKTDFYESIRKAHCPYLEQEVAFNSKGLNHLKFNGQGRARTIEEQKVRFNLLKYAPEIISRSHTVQGILVQQNEEKIRSLGETKVILSKVTFYEFMAVLDDKRIKVILKQLNDGNIFFWSVIPYWKKTQTGRRVDSIERGEL